MYKGRSLLRAAFTQGEGAASVHSCSSLTDHKAGNPAPLVPDRGRRYENPSDPSSLLAPLSHRALVTTRSGGASGSMWQQQRAPTRTGKHRSVCSAHPKQLPVPALLLVWRCGGSGALSEEGPTDPHAQASTAHTHPSTNDRPSTSTPHLHQQLSLIPISEPTRPD